MAYADGVVYVLANNLATDFTNGLTLELHPFSENTSDLVAIDVNLGRVSWNVSLPSGGYGGATVVNDLVFTGTFDGMLYAFKRRKVSSLELPARSRVNSFPYTVYHCWLLPARVPSVFSVSVLFLPTDPELHCYAG